MSGLIIIAVLLVVCVIFPPAAFIIIPYIIFSIIAGYGIRALKPKPAKDLEPAIDNAANTIAAAITNLNSPQQNEDDWEEDNETIWNPPSSTEEEELPEPEVIVKEVDDYFKKRAVMLDD